MKNWRKYCTLSLVHFMAYPEVQSGDGDFSGSIERLAEMEFFGALEMGLVNRAADRAAVRWLAEQHHLAIGVGVQPFLLAHGIDLNSPDRDTRLAGVHSLLPLIEQSDEMGAVNIEIMSGKDPGDALRTAAYADLQDSVERLSARAEQRGMRLSLEIFDRAIEKKALVGPAAEAAAFAREVRGVVPEFGLIYDMGHMPLLDESPASALPVLAPYLTGVHLGSCVLDPANPIYGDKHPRFGYPGGVADTPELVSFLRELFKIGYLGSDLSGGPLPKVGFEVRPHAAETTDDILTNIQSTWEAAWSQL